MSKKPLLILVIPAMFFTAFVSHTYAALTQSLSVGSKGAQVSELQQGLKDLGFFNGEVIAKFGPATKTAVIKFQKAYGISQTGAVGPQTRTKFNQIIANKTSKPNSTVPPVTTTTNPSTWVTTIATCTDIGKPGKYILNKDIISPAGKSCIRIHDTNNVEIDCASHTISSDIGSSAIFVEKVTDFTIGSCILKNKTTSPSRDALSDALIVMDSQNGTIVKNMLATATFSSISNSSSVKVTDNNIYGQFLVYSSKKVLVTNNNFVFVPAGQQMNAGTLLNLQNGSNNKVIGNTFDGGSDGIPKINMDDEIGADDSITMAEESNDIFQDNVIKNNWDCGIENTGFIFDSKIINNRIKNAGVGGICGWYYSSVKGNIFDGNIVDDSPEMFHFFRDYGIKDSGSPKVYFKDNIFSNNKLLNQRNDNSEAGHVASLIVIELPGNNINGIRPVTQKDIVVGNNTFANNDFGKIRAPNFYPKEMIFDGGGNICAQPTDIPNYPLSCR